jgi:hypothetical protein
MADFADLWSKHPANDEPPLLSPCTNSQGSPSFANECAVRMSVCLVRSGIDLVSYRGVFCWYGHGHQHAIRAEELGAWLDSAAATFLDYAEKRKRTARVPITAESYVNRQGIALFKNFWGPGNQGDHIDLWDGAEMTHGDPSYFSLSEEVWFWDLA